MRFWSLFTGIGGFDEPRVSQGSLFDLSSSAEDSLVRTYPWLESVLGWLENAQASGSCSDVSLLSAVPVGFSSRTYLDFCHRTEDGTWEPSSGRWGTWGMGGRIGCLTLSGSESPSDAAVCSLSDVLETTDVTLEKAHGPGGGEMRLREFFERLPRDGWWLSHCGEIRRGPDTREECQCPVSSIGGLSVHYYKDVAVAEGIPERLSETIAAAADDPAFPTEHRIRRLLLRHFNLTE